MCGPALVLWGRILHCGQCQLLPEIGYTIAQQLGVHDKAQQKARTKACCSQPESLFLFSEWAVHWHPLGLLPRRDLATFPKCTLSRGTTSHVTPGILRPCCLCQVSALLPHGSTTKPTRHNPGDGAHLQNFRLCAPLLIKTCGVQLLPQSVVLGKFFLYNSPYALSVFLFRPSLGSQGSLPITAPTALLSPDQLSAAPPLHYVAIFSPLIEHFCSLSSQIDFLGVQNDIFI